MNKDYVLIIPILFPILAGIVACFLGKMHLGQKGQRLYETVCLIVEVCLTFMCFTGNKALDIWKLTTDITISLKVDDLSRIFAGLTVIVWLLVGIYAFEYLEDDPKSNLFFGFYLITEGLIAALSFADNMITFYMFFEMMTLMSVPLVMHDGTHEAIMAGLKYLFYSIAGAFLTLFGIFMLIPYGVLGSFTAGGIMNMEALAGHDLRLMISAICMIIGLGTKAGMFPMHAWLPTAHPEAPAPASAVLSGVITKTGVLGIIRTVYFCIGSRLIAGTWVQNTWIVLSLITVIMGSMMAYREKQLKKRLAYSTVSQVSYIMFGLAVMNGTAFMGAVAHVVFHSLIKTTLFLMSGAVIHKTGHHLVSELKGTGKEMPITMWCYTIVSIALVGIPPLSGFVSKWYIATGALMSGEKPYSWIGPVALLISALLTAGYLLSISIQGFMPGADYDYEHLENKEPSAYMYIPMILMTIATIFLGIVPGGLTRIIDTIANTIF
ncbi:MAG: proton-conducting membrane transporter [Lachnospiraceae bacterium]|nr:proton-conducting membrane transporter [Lachnospiraceae bacterium]